MGANQNTDWHSVAASAIDWWIAAGVDASVDETPRDWLAAIVAPARAATTRTTGPVVAEAPPVPVLPDTLDAFLAWRAGGEAPEAAWPGATIAAQGPVDAPVLVLVDAPSRALLGADVARARESLRVVNLMNGKSAVTVEAVASFHPRFLLERPAQKAEAWRDLQLLIGGRDT